MVLVKRPVPGRPTIWMIVGQGPIVLAVGAGCLDIFTQLYVFSSLSLSLWETARYRLKYCLKGPLSPKQPPNQIYVLSRNQKNIRTPHPSVEFTAEPTAKTDQTTFAQAGASLIKFFS